MRITIEEAKDVTRRYYNLNLARPETPPYEDMADAINEWLERKEKEAGDARPDTSGTN